MYRLSHGDRWTPLAVSRLMAQPSRQHIFCRFSAPLIALAVSTHSRAAWRPRACAFLRSQFAREAFLSRTAGSRHPGSLFERRLRPPPSPRGGPFDGLVCRGAVTLIFVPPSLKHGEQPGSRASQRFLVQRRCSGSKSRPRAGPERALRAGGRPVGAIESTVFERARRARRWSNLLP